MSKKNPKPGKGLSKVIKFADEIKVKIANAIVNNDGESVDKLMAKIEKDLNYSPDDYKFLIENISQEVTKIVEQTNGMNERLFMLEAAQCVLENQLIEHMQSDKKESITGETWTYALEKDNPRIDIDPMQIPADYMMRIPNQKMIGERVAAGHPVPGVIVKPNFKLVPMLNKKEVQNGQT